MRLPLILSFSLLPFHVMAADLLNIYQDALTADTELAKVLAQYQQQEARQDQAESGLKPQVSATANVSRQHTSPSSQEDYTSHTLGLSASQVVYQGSLYAQVDAAQAQVKASQAQYEQAQQELMLRSAQAYFAVLRAQDALRTAQAQETAIKRQLDQAKQQFEVGLIAITGVHEAQAAYDQARANRLGAEGQLRVTQDALEQLTGQSYAALDVLKDDIPIQAPEPNQRQHWEERALAHNLSLVSAAYGVEAAQANIKAQQAQHYPSLSFYAEHQRTDNAQGMEIDRNSTVYGVRANVDVYAGGRTQAQVRESRYALEEAQAQQESARRSVLQNARSLFTLVNTDVLTVQARKLAIRSNQSALEATRTGYEVGTRNIVDVLNAERNLYAAQRDYDQARYDYVINMLQLKFAAGVLTQEDLATLNQWLKASS
ncbi:outer membrane protein [Allopseudospirillum japonicum]|uniref:Outer membrane protein n=1 Tax=Allopseudospirillum japonicum TaxID=64971 RepID=A0A1H6RLW6_9GAMM|nr:TolC family outer membrane protein [Allopseudospirillum japonicum]SEI52780.1 outer membrane protein [Allopseudospirillum japonicum]